MVSRARSNIHAVVTHPESSDRQKILIAAEAGFGDARRQYDRAVLADQLGRSNLRLMLFKLRHGDMIVAIKDAETQICKTRFSSDIVEVTSERDVKGRANRHDIAHSAIVVWKSQRSENVNFRNTSSQLKAVMAPRHDLLVLEHAGPCNVLCGGALDTFSIHNAFLHLVLAFLYLCILHSIQE